MTHLLRTTTRRLSGEGGSAVLTAVVLLTIMMTTSLALLTYVDTETKQSGVVRSRETAFNYAEAAMNAQIFALAQEWAGPGEAATPYGTCEPATGGTRCPTDAQLRGLFPTPDTDPTAQWTTRVLDNQAPYADFYSEAMLQGTTYGYDRGGKEGTTTPDGKVWVRAEATAKGRTRKMVALVRAEEQQEDIFTSAFLAGRLDISNMGKKTIISSQGGGVVTVRCDVNDSTCLGHDVGSGGIKDEGDLQSLLNHQITPNQTATNYTGPNAMSTESILRMRATAQAYGTFYTSCPATLTGKVVWLDNITCSYTGNSTYNTLANPGVLFLNGGKLSLGGTTNFNGVIYYTDLDGTNTIPSSPAVIELGGNTHVEGGVIVDGAGLVTVGSSGGQSDGNIKFNGNAFGRVRSLATAGIIQNTWRELTPR